MSAASPRRPLPAIAADLPCPQCNLRDPDPTPDPLSQLRRCALAAGKGFAIGAGLKGGLALFSILARLRSRRSLPRKLGAVTNAEAVVEAAKETVRYGMFLGAFAGTFVSVDELIATLLGHRSRLQNNSLSGFIPKSLINIVTLQILDLSNNNLEGEVPSNGSFSLFTPISFANNPLLCGPGTSKICPGAPPFSPPPPFNPQVPLSPQDFSVLET